MLLISPFPYNIQFLYKQLQININNTSQKWKVPWGEKTGYVTLSSNFLLDVII